MWFFLQYWPCFYQLFLFGNSLTQKSFIFTVVKAEKSCYKLRPIFFAQLYTTSQSGLSSRPFKATKSERAQLSLHKTAFPSFVVGLRLLSLRFPLLSSKCNWKSASLPDVAPPSPSPPTSPPSSPHSFPFWGTLCKFPSSPTPTVLVLPLLQNISSILQWFAKLDVNTKMDHMVLPTIDLIQSHPNKLWL